MNYYSHHIGDFNNATIHLSVEEECMYHRALAWYYSNELPLPSDKVKLYRYLRATSAKLKAAVDNVLEDFFVEQEDGFHQSRCDEEIAAFKDKSELASKAGKASAAKRAEKSATDDKQELNGVSTDVQQDFNGRSTNQEPITKNQEPIIKNKQTNVRENFSPKLEDLNTRLKMAGGTAIDQKTLDQTLVTFVPHYETQFLTDNQLLGKLVQWVKRDQDKPKFAPAKTQKTKQVHGNVNADWGNPPPPDLSVPYILDAESIAIRQELPF